MFFLLLWVPAFSPNHWLSKLTQNKTQRFICQLPVEEMFNRIKKQVNMSANNACTPQRAMTIAINKSVLSTLNRFDEVTRDTESSLRSFTFSKNAFPPLQESRPIG